MRRYFSSISSILLGVSILCLNFAFTTQSVQCDQSGNNANFCGYARRYDVPNCNCCQGQYKEISYVFGVPGYRCLSCPPGTYQNQDYHQQTSCNKCLAGTYNQNSFAWVCTSCQAGKFSAAVGATVASTCAVCGAGKYSAAGASVCTDCDAGKYGASTGLSVCTNCAAGKFTILAATSSSVCISCDAGKYSATTGASTSSTCINCGAGKYSTIAGATTVTSCLDCAAGKSSASGSNSATACVDCPGNQYSLIGSACVNCVIGKFSEAGASECSICTEVLAQYAAYQRMPDHLQTCFPHYRCYNYCENAFQYFMCGTGTGLGFRPLAMHRSWHA